MATFLWMGEAGKDSDRRPPQQVKKTTPARLQRSATGAERLGARNAGIRPAATRCRQMQQGGASTAPPCWFATQTLLASVQAVVLEHARQLLLDLKFLALHQAQGIRIDRQHPQIRIQHFLVQPAVAVVELAKLGVLLHQVIDFRLLTFKHR
jgi:hypothetical protein